MKILQVLTSHDQLGNTGRKTGFWIEEGGPPKKELIKGQMKKNPPKKKKKKRAGPK